MGLGSLAGGGVGGLGLRRLPAAFAEGPATGSGGGPVGSGRGLTARLFFAGGFANVSGLSPSRVMVLGEVVGSRGRVRFGGRMDRERVLCPVVMPKAGRRLARTAMSDRCAAARLSSTSLTFRGRTGAKGRDTGGAEERVSSWLSIGV
jgi:hypothetical protein